MRLPAALEEHCCATQRAVRWLFGPAFSYFSFAVEDWFRAINFCCCPGIPARFHSGRSSNALYLFFFKRSDKRRIPGDHGILTWDVYCETRPRMPIPNRCSISAERFCERRYRHFQLAFKRAEFSNWKKASTSRLERARAVWWRWRRGRRCGALRPSGLWFDSLVV